MLEKLNAKKAELEATVDCLNAEIASAQAVIDEKKAEIVNVQAKKAVVEELIQEEKAAAPTITYAPVGCTSASDSILFRK